MAKTHPFIRVIAEQVLEGRWGDGNERINKLTLAGFRYITVQAEVERLVRQAEAEAMRRKVWRHIE